jgi:hypothetical protein
MSRRAKSSTCDFDCQPINTASNVDLGHRQLIVLAFNRPSARQYPADPLRLDLPVSEPGLLRATVIGRLPTRVAGQFIDAVLREVLA